MKAYELSSLSDEQLAGAAAEALGRLQPRAQAFALALAAGKPAATAARELGRSTNARVLARLKVRAREVLALLREQARRRAVVTAEETASWFDALAQAAWAAEDYSAARGARREAALIRGQYPKDQAQLLLGTGAVQILVVNTGVPPRDGSPALPAVTRESPVALEAPQNGVEVMGHSDSQRAGEPQPEEFLS